MEKSCNFWAEFFTALPEMKTLFSPNARRNGISEDAAILLTVFAEFPDIELPVKNEVLAELTNKGLIIFGDEKLKITGKGAIIAKSFIELRKTKF